MEVRIEPSWKAVLADEFDRDYFAKLADFVRNAYRIGVVYPPARHIFHAFERTPFDKVKAVIIGQDPYHEPGQAQGLAFYVPPGIRTPPSLLNIAKELAAEFPAPAGEDAAPLRIPDLLSWADQGVLLLNATLTVGAGMAGSHQNRGWERFTDAVIDRLARRREHLVYLLWGSFAQRKAALVDRSRNCVLESAHPSPLSAHRGFFGCGHFLKANAYLQSHGANPIRW